MTTKSRAIEKHTFKSPHAGERFKIDLDGDDVNMFWISHAGHIRCILAGVPRDETILLLKEMTMKLEHKWLDDCDGCGRRDVVVKASIVSTMPGLETSCPEDYQDSIGLCEKCHPDWDDE